MDQLRRDVLELLRFSLAHPPEAAPLFFPMFRPEEIRALYDIPATTRQRIWTNRNRAEYQSLIAHGLPPAPGS